MVDLIVVWCIALIVVLGFVKVRGIVFNAGKRLTRVFRVDGASSPVKMELDNKHRSESRKQESEIRWQTREKCGIKEEKENTKPTEKHGEGLRLNEEEMSKGHQQLHQEHTDHELALPLVQDTKGVPDEGVTPPPLSHRHQQLHEEQTDHELALRLAQDTKGEPDEGVTPPPLPRSGYVIQQQVQLAAKKYDLSKWKYSDLRDAINTSCDLELLEACRGEFRRRQKVYHSWRVKNKQKSSVGQRAPDSVMKSDPFTEMESVEFLWKMRNASEKLRKGGWIQETRQFFLAGDEWSVALQIVARNLILNLKKKALSSRIPEMFCSIGIRDCHGDIEYVGVDMPVEVQVSDRDSEDRWRLPWISWLDRYEELFPDDTLTLFVRLGRYAFAEKIPKALSTPLPKLVKFKMTVVQYLEEKLYTDINPLGRGSYGVVLSALSPNKEEVAVKIIKKEDYWRIEDETWPLLDNPHILPLMDVTPLPELGLKLYVSPRHPTSLFLLAQTADFRADINGLNRIKKWMADVVSGLDYLHSAGFAHMDIKADNVLITSTDSAVLCDFSSLAVTEKKVRRLCAPLRFWPPECWSGTLLTASRGVDGIPFDMWTYGLMALKVLTGHWPQVHLKVSDGWSWEVNAEPFLSNALQAPTLCTSMKAAMPCVQISNEDVQSALRFLLLVMKRNPSERPTAKEAARHEFLRILPADPSPPAPVASVADPIEARRTYVEAAKPVTIRATSETDPVMACGDFVHSRF